MVPTSCACGWSAATTPRICGSARTILDGIADTYRRLRNTLRYLLGNLAGFTEAERLPAEQMPELERWILHRLSELDEQVRTCNREFDYPKLAAQLHAFCAVDLSAFYFDVRKDVVYCDPVDSVAPARGAHRARRAVPLPDRLARARCSPSPPRRLGARASRTRAACTERTFPELPAGWRNAALGARWARVREIRRVVTGALELERREKRIGASLQACPTVHLGPSDRALLEGLDLAELAITSGIVLADGPAPAERLHARRRAGRGRGARPRRGREMRALLAGAARGRGIARASVPTLHRRRCGRSVRPERDARL